MGEWGKIAEMGEDGGGWGRMGKMRKGWKG